MNQAIYKVIFFLLNILMVLIAFDSTILIHEWTHGFVAWLNGVKPNPFDIYYGDWTLLNVDEAVDYKSLINAKRNWAVAFIAITPITINLLLSLYCFQLLKKPAIQTKKWLYRFCLWFSAFNLSEFFSYVPIRTFTTHADVFNFNYALNCSPWIIGLIGGFISVALIGYFFIKILPMSYYVLNITKLWHRLIYLSAMLLVFFFLGGYRGAYHYGSVSATMGIISLILIPIVFILCFPSIESDAIDLGRRVK
ncbi:MAG: hypothetical protein EPN84_10580 [Legionella sp.]|nr:MAG: hypothetical protein EPN84_10580 [Legionella sp.]